MKFKLYSRTDQEETVYEGAFGDRVRAHDYGGGLCPWLVLAHCKWEGVFLILFCSQTVLQKLEALFEITQ